MLSHSGFSRYRYLTDLSDLTDINFDFKKSSQLKFYMKCLFQVINISK